MTTTDQADHHAPIVMSIHNADQKFRFGHVKLGKALLSRHEIRKMIAVPSLLCFVKTKSAANIYFSSWETREYVRDRFEQSRPRRIKDWFITPFYLREGDNGDRAVFREVTEEETRVPDSRSIVRTTFQYPVPSTWLSHLTYRNPIKTFHNDAKAIVDYFVRTKGAS